MHLGGCAVDLVGKDQVVEDWTFLKLEAAVLGPVDLSTGDVARQQVRGELDAMKIALDDSGELFDGSRFCLSGRTLDQQMTAADQGHHQALDELFLADDAGLEPAAGLADCVENGFRGDGVHKYPGNAERGIVAAG